MHTKGATAPVVALSRLAEPNPVPPAALLHPVFGATAGTRSPSSVPLGAGTTRHLPSVAQAATEHERRGSSIVGEDGSLVTEYGLLAIVAATIAGVVIQWASGGAIVRLFNALLNAARDLVGAG